MTSLSHQGQLDKYLKLVEMERAGMIIPTVHAEDEGYTGFKDRVVSLSQATMVSGDAAAAFRSRLNEYTATTRDSTINESAQVVQAKLEEVEQAVAAQRQILTQLQQDLGDKEHSLGLAPPFREKTLRHHEDTVLDAEVRMLHEEVVDAKHKLMNLERKKDRLSTEFDSLVPLLEQGRLQLKIAQMEREAAENQQAMSERLTETSGTSESTGNAPTTLHPQKFVRTEWDMSLEDGTISKRCAAEYQGLPTRSEEGTPIWAATNPTHSWYDLAFSGSTAKPGAPDHYISDKESELAQKMEEVRERYRSIGANIPVWLQPGQPGLAKTTGAAAADGSAPEASS